MVNMGPRKKNPAERFNLIAEMLTGGCSDELGACLSDASRPSRGPEPARCGRHLVCLGAGPGSRSPEAISRVPDLACCIGSLGRAIEGESLLSHRADHTPSPP